jgi:hypothetical protein
VELIVAGAANQIASPNLNPGKGTGAVLNILKSVCKYQNGDRVLSGEIESIAEKIQSGELVNTVMNQLSLE